jgi:GAF domain-containing protein
VRGPRTATEEPLEALGRVLRAVGRARFELEPMLEQIVESTARLCRAEWGYLWMRQGDAYTPVAAWGGSQQFMDYERQHPTFPGRATLIGRTALEGRPVHIPDVLADPEYHWPEGQRLGGYRTGLGLPIRGDDDAVIGVLGLARNEVAPFSDQEIKLVALFSDQASVVIQVARLLALEHEAHEREEAIGEVLQAIGRSSFDLEQVLQAVIERAVELTRSDTGNVARRDGDVYRVVAFTGTGAEYERLTRERPYRPERGSLLGRALLERRMVHIPDVLADPEYALLDAQRAGGYRTLLAVPLIRDGEAVGAAGVGRNSVSPFSDRDMRLFQTFADQAVIAIQIARLGTEMREALERESAVSHVLQTIAGSSFDLDQVLQTVIESATELSKSDFGNILRFDESGSFYRVVAHHGDIDPAYWNLVTHTPYRADRGTVIGRTLLERRPIHIPDILEDPDYRFWDAQRTGRFRSILGIPMLRDGEPIGVFVVWRRDVRPYADREISLLTTFADQAVLAIENVRLFQTVERQRAELARFAPQAASLLSTPEGEQLLAGHRREITALFADLRGFTAFAESAEPEEVLGVLREYHAEAGALVVGNGGTLEHFAGDGLMAFFNDPTPVREHADVAVRTAVDLRDRFAVLAGAWRRRGYELGLGIGMAVGYATLGRIGFEGRYDYGAVGNVVILASRLSDAAQPGEILISQRLHAVVEERFEAEPMAALQLKGFSRPVPVFRVIGSRRNALS